MVSQELKEEIETDGPDYLIEAVRSAGLASAGPAGLVPLTWQELKAWNDLTGSNYTVWELETMRYLSQNYAAEAQKARDENCPPPHLTKIKPVSPEGIKNALRAARG